MTKSTTLLALLSALFIFLISLPSAPQEVKPKVLEGRISNQQGRIGIRTDWNRKITRIYLDSPAELAGLKVGDEIIDIDGKGKKPEIAGPAYEEVNLIIMRNNNNKLFFKITRLPSRQISRQWIRI